MAQRPSPKSRRPWRNTCWPTRSTTSRSASVARGEARPSGRRRPSRARRAACGSVWGRRGPCRAANLVTPSAPEAPEGRGRAKGVPLPAKTRRGRVGGSSVEDPRFRCEVGFERDGVSAGVKYAQPDRDGVSAGLGVRPTRAGWRVCRGEVRPTRAGWRVRRSGCAPNPRGMACPQGWCTPNPRGMARPQVGGYAQPAWAKTMSAAAALATLARNRAKALGNPRATTLTTEQRGDETPAEGPRAKCQPGGRTPPKVCRRPVASGEWPSSVS